ncbi:hypothetical protein ACFLVN_02560 [Chloroflexota bacterium]
MRKRTVYALAAGLAAVAAVALMLAFVVIPGGAEDMKSFETSLADGITVQDISTISDSPVEGITVHGHWTVNVLNPDGSMVAHREFDNRLVGDGNEKLTSILARQHTPGRWFVTLGGGPMHARW